MVFDGYLNSVASAILINSGKFTIMDFLKGVFADFTNSSQAAMQLFISKLNSIRSD